MSTSLTFQDRELLLRRIDEARARLFLGVSGPLLSAPTGSVDASIPTPSGLQSSNIVGAVAFRWNPVSAEVRYYEINIATNDGFSDAVTRTTVSPEYIYTAGSLGTTYYVRVRAVVGNDVSNWSSILNTTTGKAFFDDLDEGAVTNLVTQRIATFSPSILDTRTATTSATYGSATITLRNGEVLFPFVIMKGEHINGGGYFPFSSDPGGIRFDLVRDGSPIGDTFESSVDEDARTVATLSEFATPDEPGAGTYVYGVQVGVFTTDITGEYTTFDPELLVMELVGMHIGT